MSRFLPLLWMAGLVAAASGPAPGGPPSGALAPVFRDDARLGKVVSVAHTDRPLGELLPLLGGQLGITLTTTADTADDRMTLVIGSRHAGDVLTRIAAHFDFGWRRLGSGYELVQDAGSERREQALRLADFAALQAELDRVAALAGTPRERLQARSQELERRLKTPELSAGERARIQEEHAAVRAAARSPEGTPALAVSLMRSLAAPLRAELLTQHEIRLSTEDGLLSDEAAARVHRVAEYLAKQFGPLPPREADVTVRLQEGPSGSTFGPRSSSDRRFRLDIRFGSLRGDPKEPQTWFASLRLGDSNPAPAALPAPEDPVLQREVTLTLPGPPRQPQLIAGGSFTSSALTGTVWPPRATIGDIAEAIHSATGMDVVADSFVGARLDPAPLRLRQPLVRILDTVARELNYTWEKDGSLLRLRNRYYYRDRPAEVPERILRPWREQVARSGRLTLDHLADLAAALTDPQTRGMQQFWGWYVDAQAIPSPGLFHVHRQHLRLWASLDPPRRAAAQLAILPTERMTPVQRQAWLAALASPSEHDSERRRRVFTPAEVAAGGLRVNTHVAYERLLVRTAADGRIAAMSVLGSEEELRANNFAATHPEYAPHGPATRLDEHFFWYYVGGEKKPSHGESINIPAPSVK